MYTQRDMRFCLKTCTICSRRISATNFYSGRLKCKKCYIRRQRGQDKISVIKKEKFEILDFFEEEHKERKSDRERSMKTLEIVSKYKIEKCMRGYKANCEGCNSIRASTVNEIYIKILDADLLKN